MSCVEIIVIVEQRRTGSAQQLDRMLEANDRYDTVTSYTDLGNLLRLGDY
jgi:hypothetical protein